jgi:hypothetical protein
MSARRKPCAFCVQRKDAETQRQPATKYHLGLRAFLAGCQAQTRPKRNAAITPRHCSRSLTFNNWMNGAAMAAVIQTSAPPPPSPQDYVISMQGVTKMFDAKAAYCDWVGVLSQGRLLTVDTPEGLRRRAFGGDLVVALARRLWHHFAARHYAARRAAAANIARGFVRVGRGVAHSRAAPVASSDATRLME